MKQFRKYISVVERRILAVDAHEAFLLPLLEPLFAIKTHMAFEERAKLFGLARSLRMGFVACEIGSYVGASTSFLAAAASFRQGHVHAVDTWNNDAMPNEPIEDTWERFTENTSRFRLFITPHRGLASDVKHEVPELDLLFIDGDHSYQGTLQHLADFAPKIVAGGYLAMHDFNFDSVQAAVADYFRDRALEPLELAMTLKIFRLPGRVRDASDSGAHGRLSP
jgi:predicted O-methyltransferase YrrM